MAGWLVRLRFVDVLLVYDCFFIVPYFADERRAHQLGGG